MFQSCFNYKCAKRGRKRIRRKKIFLIEAPREERAPVRLKTGSFRTLIDGMGMGAGDWRVNPKSDFEPLIFADFR